MQCGGQVLEFATSFKSDNAHAHGFQGLTVHGWEGTWGRGTYGFRVQVEGLGVHALRTPPLPRAKAVVHRSREAMQLSCCGAAGVV